MHPTLVLERLQFAKCKGIMQYIHHALRAIKQSVLKQRELLSPENMRVILFIMARRSSIDFRPNILCKNFASSSRRDRAREKSDAPPEINKSDARAFSCFPK